MTLGRLVEWAIYFAIAIPAIVFHEVAHGFVAYLLGDPTAKSRGRLSLNPLRHIDPFGTLLLPVLLIVMGFPAFGYAKPVPVNPRYFRDHRKGMFMTGLAGPSMNLAFAVLAGLIFRLAGTWLVNSLGVVGEYAAVAIYYFCLINLVLMFFNLIPIPPLDGSRVLPLFLSDRALRSYIQLERYGFLILLAVIWLAPRFLGFDPVDTYLGWTVFPLLQLFAGGG